MLNLNLMQLNNKSLDGTKLKATQWRCSLDTASETVPQIRLLGNCQVMKEQFVKPLILSHVFKEWLKDFGLSAAK